MAEARKGGGGLVKFRRRLCPERQEVLGGNKEKSSPHELP